MPFYGCCGDTNNESNEYQGARATAVAPRTDGAIFLAGPGYNRTTPNSVYGRLFYGTGAGGPRYSWYDRKTNNYDSYAEAHEVKGAVSFDNLTSCALTRYCYKIAKGGNTYDTTYKTVLMPNASKHHHVQLGDASTVPVDMVDLGDHRRAVSLARHKVAGKWTHTLWVTRHASDSSKVGTVHKPALEQTWTVQFGDDDAPVGLAAVGDEGAVVAGTTKVANVKQILVARLDKTGQVAWKQLWVGSDTAIPYGIGWVDGGAVLAGQKRATVAGTTTYFVWLRRFSADGDLMWDRKVMGDGKNNTHGFDVIGRAKGFAVGGRVNNQNALLRLSSEGHVIGDRRFGNTIYDWKGMASGFVGVGFKQTGSSYQNKRKQNVYIVRTDPFGNTACTEKEGCKDGTCLAGTQLDQYAACSDGTKCTKNGKCGADGTCQLQPVCNDGKPSTLDKCAEDGSCTYVAMATGAACDDGNFCTEGTTCDAGGSVCGGPNTCSSGTCTSPVTSGWAKAIAGSRLVCAVLADGKRSCWGLNQYELLGDGVEDFRPDEPRADLASPVFKQLVVSDYHLCGIVKTSGVRQLVIAQETGIAVHSDGTVSTWGSNQYGLLGIGDSGSVLQKPTKLSGVSGVVSVSSGTYNVCFVKSDCTVWCWGYGGYGANGNGAKDSLYSPTTVEGLTGAVEVAVSERTVCARLKDGTVTCWGYNSHGQLGDGTTTQQNKPVTKVTDLSGVVQLARSFIAPCALKSDGSVWCWGYGADNGDGAGTTHALTPVLVKGSK